MKFQIPGGAAWAAVGAIAGSVLCCSVADAQWKPDRLDTSGPGVKLGEKLELHPGLAVRAGYDTNVYKGDDKPPPGQKALGAGLVAVSPYLALSTQGQVRATQGESANAVPEPLPVALRLGAGLTYAQYFSPKVPDHLLDVDSELYLGILPSKPNNFVVAGTFTRSARPFGQAVYQARSSTYAVDIVKPSATLNLGTTSKVLTGSVTYAPSIRRFEDKKNFRFLSSFGQQVDAGIGWKFFPQTAIISALTYQTNKYTNVDEKPAGTGVLLSDGSAFKTRIGVNGAVTTNFIFRALAGYAVGFYDSKLLEEFEDVIADVSLGYRIAQVHTLSIGYNRDIVPSPGGAWVRTDRVNAGAGLKFADAFGVTLEGGYGYLTYGDMVGLADPDGNMAGVPDDQLKGLGRGSDPFKRRDNRVDAALRLQYDATTWLAIVADATVQAVMTDFDYAVVNPADPTTRTSDLADPAGYTAFQFYGGTRLHY